MLMLKDEDDGLCRIGNQVLDSDALFGMFKLLELNSIYFIMSEMKVYNFRLSSTTIHALSDVSLSTLTHCFRLLLYERSNYLWNAGTLFEFVAYLCSEQIYIPLIFANLQFDRQTR